VGENVYLKSRREDYDALRKSIAGLQQRAAEAKRELTNEEQRSIAEMGEKAKLIYGQIEDLSEIELRNAKVEAMNQRVADSLAGAAHDFTGAPGALIGQGTNDDGTDGGDPNLRTAGNLGGARTTARDPGIYRQGGQFSFVGDHWRSATTGDRGARDRIAQHTTAILNLAENDPKLRDVLGAGASTGGAGLVPPVWLAEQFAPILHRRLRLATVLRQVPWAGPFAWSIPVAGTAAQTSTVAEGVNATETDPTYTILTVTPQAITGFSEVSRQMLEASNPAVDAIIWGDLTGDFFDKAEAAVITAVNNQANVNAVTVSAGLATTTDIIAQRNGILDGIAAVSDNSAGDAAIFVGRTSRWTSYLKMVDTTGRPLILAQAYNPSNAIGIGSAINGFRSPIQGSLESLVVVTSPTVAASTGFIINPDELLFSISPPMQFQYDQPAGPALIRVGIWGYEAVVTGRRPKAITKVTYSGS
jgi:hypothetical protein